MKSINTAVTGKTNQENDFPETNSKQHKSLKCKMLLAYHKSHAQDLILILNFLLNAFYNSMISQNTQD